MNLSSLLGLLGPILVAVYTYNYADWARREGLRRGAIGLYLIAAATVAVPGALLLLPH